MIESGRPGLTIIVDSKRITNEPNGNPIVRCEKNMCNERVSLKYKNGTLLLGKCSKCKRIYCISRFQW